MSELSVMAVNTAPLQVTKQHKTSRMRQEHLACWLGFQVKLTAMLA